LVIVKSLDLWWQTTLLDRLDIPLLSC